MKTGITQTNFSTSLKACLESSSRLRKENPSAKKVQHDTNELRHPRVCSAGFPTCRIAGLPTGRARNLAFYRNFVYCAVHWQALMFMGLIFMLTCTVPSTQAAQVLTNRMLAPRPQFSPTPPGQIRAAAAFSQLDPLTVAMLQQAALESNVVAEAEFDPPVIPLGETATYRVVVTALSEAVSLPEKLPVPPGLELKPGARGMSFAPMAQVTQSRTTFNYRVTVGAQGTYNMPAFPAMANGRPITIPAAQLMVVAPGAGPTILSPRLLAEAPAGDVYVGQAVQVQVVLLDPGDNSVLGMQPPQAQGDAYMVEQTLGRQRREMRQFGARTVAAIVNEVTVIPIKEGQHPLTVQAFIYQNRGTNNRMSALQGYGPLLDSEPLTLSVKHLPKPGELPGFTGLIGSFQMDVPRLSTNEVRAGDPVMMIVSVRGEGNLTRLVPPKLDRAPGWQIFPPIPDMTPAIMIQQRGSYIFMYTMIPLTYQTRATPAIPFCYFDPKRKSYVDLTVPPVTIKVTPAPLVAASSGATNESMNAGDSELNPPKNEKGRVLTGLLDKPGRRQASLVPFQQRPWFVLLLLLPGVGLWGLWTWDRRRRFLGRHPEIILKQRARRGVRRQLRLARRAAAVQDTAGFIAAFVDAMREACAPHIAANPKALVCADIVGELPRREREGPAGDLVRALFREADALRFTNKLPDGADVLSLQPKLEHLLAEFRKRL